MQAQLTFNLNELDDRMAHFRAVKSLDMALVLWELASNSRKSLEYELEAQEMRNGKPLDEYEVLDLVFERIYQLLNSHDINVDKLII